MTTTGSGTDPVCRTGKPTWSANESAAVPIVQDNPLGGPPWPNDHPTIGHLSVTYSTPLDLWLMTYDGGRQQASTNGIYFTYAQTPWGPWAAPQLIFNAVRDHGGGVFIHAPPLNPPGPAGPTIGGNDPNTTRGVVYAPCSSVTPSMKSSFTIGRERRRATRSR